MPLFNDPNTAVLALVIGLLAILFEFHVPGTVVPGVAGSALVLLAAAALSHYPLRPAAVGIIATATVLMVLEVKITSRGVLSVIGAILLACGVYLLIDSPDTEQHIRSVTALGIVLPFGLLTAFLLTIAARARDNKAVTGSSTLVGKTGTVMAAPNSFRIQVAGEYWNAVSPEPLAPGMFVRVTEIHGLELSVRPLPTTGTIG